MCPIFIVKDESGWDQLIRKMRDDIRLAQERDDQVTARRLQDEFVEYECMDVCI